MELVSVAAVAENRIIGLNGEIPWESLPEDRAQYWERIADDTVILGRRKFDSMIDDLPGRVQIVLSRSERDYDVGSTYHTREVSKKQTIRPLRSGPGQCT